MKKIIIITIGIVILILGILVGVKINRNDENKINLNNQELVNTSETLNKEIMLGNLKINNIELMLVENGNTRLLADVENTEAQESKMKFIIVTLLDKNKKELETANELILPLEPGERTMIDLKFTSKFEDVYDFIITEKN